MIYIAFLVFTFFILTIAFYEWQYFMIFSPTYYRKSDLGKDCELLSIKTDDGVELEGVVYEPLVATQTLLVFNGRYHDSVGLINKLASTYPNIRLITFNYRSYGRSQGRASEKNLLQDSVKIAKIVQKHYGDFSVLGFSLGTNFASFIATKHPIKSLFLVGAFDSLAGLVKNKIGLNLSLFFRYKFDTLAYIKTINVPIYLFSSKEDEVIHIKNVRILKENVKYLAHYEELDGVNHDNLMFHTDIVKKINRILDDTKTM